MASLFDTLVSILRSRFSGRGMRLDAGQPPRVVFPAANSAVGDLVLSDDGDEITVTFGNFTHSHYGPFQYAPGSRDLVDSLESLIDDLEALFHDQLVMWGSHSSGGGIFRRGQEPLLKRALKERHYVWSGPISNESDG